VRSRAELDAALRRRSAGRPVMLDFYADWCVSCKEMERFTFSESAVRQKLARRIAAEGRRDEEQRDDRDCSSASPVRPARHHLLRSQGTRDSPAARDRYQDSERFLETLSGVGL
jgi:thiol:disulfide interchange protein DsbD